MKKILKLISVVVFVLLAVILFNTVTLKSKQIAVEPVAKIKIDDQSVNHLSEAIQFKTVSYDDPDKFDSVQFNSFRSFLQTTYPLINSNLERIIINQNSLLYKWQGSNNSLQPIIILAHMDVVPVSEESAAEWIYSPFSGRIKDGFVWGRGTLDDKGSVISICEAVNRLLLEGFKPQQTIYLAFGHDEEIGGKNGAVKIVEYLKSQHVKAEYVLDEGMVVTKDIVPGIETPVALIGISEKGYMSAELTVDFHGGHSSMPGKETAIGILSNAIVKLQSHPFPSKFSNPVKQFLSYVGPEMPFSLKLAFANLWLFNNTIIKKYEAKASGNASVRTTIAPTIFNSGVKDNVLPDHARAVLNFRILPEQTTDDVIAYVKQTINDERVVIKKIGPCSEASPVSNTQSLAYSSIEKAIRQTYSMTITAPSLVIAATDSRHYRDVTENTFRFLPVVLNSDDLGRIHGVNERISIEDYKEGIRFYYQLIKNTGK